MLMHEDSPGDTAPEPARFVPPGRSEPTSDKKLRAGDLRDYRTLETGRSEIFVPAIVGDHHQY